MVFEKCPRFRVIIPVLLLVILIQIFFITFKEEWNRKTVQIAGLPSDYSLSSFGCTDNQYKYLYKNNSGGYFNLVYTPDTELSLNEYLKSEDVHAKYTTLIQTNNGMASSYLYGNKGDYTCAVKLSNSMIVMNSSIDRYELTQIIRTISIRE